VVEASGSTITATGSSVKPTKNKKNSKGKTEVNTMGEIMKVLLKGGDWQQINKQLIIIKVVDWVCKNFKEGNLGEILGEVLQQNG
jgi:hypothetical protein